MQDIALEDRYQYVAHTYVHTVLPQLVRMRTIKLMSFSGFVLTERAYYSAVHSLTYHTDLFFYTYLKALKS